jgi:hypothetical protein
MDGERFDALSRALVAVSHRRRLLQTIGGGTLGALVAWFDLHDAVACRPKGRRCRRNRHCCGTGVCARGRCRCRGANSVCGGTCCRHCFVEDNPDAPALAFCCTPEQVCRSPRGQEFDLCCYPDEICDAATGTCCRTCGDGTGGQTCCGSDEFCSTTTDRCTPFSSARLHRFRR